MGLDLYHLKATLEPQSPVDGFDFHVHEFDAEMLDQLGFRRYLQTIPDVEHPARIVIAGNRVTIDRLSISESGCYEKVVATFIGRPSDLIPRIVQIEKEYGLDPSGRGVTFRNRWLDRRGIHHEFSPYYSAPDWEWVASEGTTTIQQELDRHPPQAGIPIEQLIEICYSQSTSFVGLYAVEAGYQRKGMSDEFFHRFSREFYYRRADVELAATLLWDLHGPEHKERLAIEFRRAFIENFEEGRSFLYISS